MVKRRLLAAGALALVAGAGLPAPAQAATYRYWSYWVGDSGDWAFSNIGPASRIPADGAVEGWRFAEAGLAGGPAPAVAPTFDDVCGDTEPPAEGKRVAVIVDPGSADEAPDGESPPGAWAMCVTADADATGYAVLRAAAEVRLDRGLVCGIGGYPAAECAVVVREPDVSTPTPTPRPTEKPSGGPDEPSEEKSRTPKPTPADTSVSESASTPSASASRSASVAREPASTSTSPSSASSPATLPTPSASPTVSLLATPVAPDQGGGGSAIIAGLALLAVGALGAAAVLRGRRRRS